MRPKVPPQVINLLSDDDDDEKQTAIPSSTSDKKEKGKARVVEDPVIILDDDAPAEFVSDPEIPARSNVFKKRKRRESIPNGEDEQLKRRKDQERKDLVEIDDDDDLDDRGVGTSAGSSASMDRTKSEQSNDQHEYFKDGSADDEDGASDIDDETLARRLADEDHLLAQKSADTTELDRLLAAALQEQEHQSAKREAKRRKNKKSDANEDPIIFRKVIERDKDGAMTSPDGDVDEDDIRHLQLILAAFEKAGEGWGNQLGWGTQYQVRYRVTKVEYVVNSTLSTRYAAKKHAFSKAKKPTTELLLFHGTAKANVESILRDGFKIGGRGGHRAAHGTSCGRGIYSSPNPLLPMTYSIGHSAIIGFKALPGYTSSDPREGWEDAYSDNMARYFSPQSEGL
ncbi:hypothetical protein HK104_009888 [Borealophlyctis nickersoniae]|nr:hypothetical protein HK104_009888 [Borealophlyctis nickersoniae]